MDLMRQKLTSAYSDRLYVLQFIKYLKSQAFIDELVRECQLLYVCWELISQLLILNPNCDYTNLDKFKSIERQTHFHLTNLFERTESIFVEQRRFYFSFRNFHIHLVQSTSTINETLDEFPNFAFKSFFTLEILSVSFISGFLVSVIGHTAS